MHISVSTSVSLEILPKTVRFSLCCQSKRYKGKRKKGTKDVRGRKLKVPPNFCLPHKIYFFHSNLYILNGVRYELFYVYFFKRLKAHYLVYFANH